MSFTRVVRAGAIIAASAGASGLAYAQPAFGPWAGAMYRDLGAFEFTVAPTTKERPTPVLALSGDGQSVAFNLVQPDGSARAAVWRTDGVYRFADDPSLRFMRQALAMNYDGSMVTVSAQRVTVPVPGAAPLQTLRATRSTVGATIGVPQLIPGSAPANAAVAPEPGSVAFSPNLDAAIVRDSALPVGSGGAATIRLIGFNSSGAYLPTPLPLPSAEMGVLIPAGIRADGTVVGRSYPSNSAVARGWTRLVTGEIVAESSAPATVFAPHRLVGGGQLEVGTATISGATVPAIRFVETGELRVPPPTAGGFNLGNGRAVHDASVDGSVLIGGAASDLSTNSAPQTDLLSFISIYGVTYDSTSFMRNFIGLPARYFNVTITDVSDDGVSLAGIMADSEGTLPSLQRLRVFHVTIPSPGTSGVLLATSILASRRRRA